MDLFRLHWVSAYMGVFTDVFQHVQSAWSAFPADPHSRTDVESLIRI